MNLNLKNMVSTYTDMVDSREELWAAFLTLRNAGFISEETWVKFFRKCSPLDDERIAYDL